MPQQFWILIAVAVVACLILFFIDLNKDPAKKNSLIAGYIALIAALFVLVWFFNKIPAIVIYGAAVVAAAYFGRYFIGKIAGRKV